MYIGEPGRCDACGDYEIIYTECDYDEAPERVNLTYHCTECGSYGVESYALVYLGGDAEDGE